MPEELSPFAGAAEGFLQGQHQALIYEMFKDRERRQNALTLMELGKLSPDEQEQILPQLIQQGTVNKEFGQKRLSDLMIERQQDQPDVNTIMNPDASTEDKLAANLRLTQREAGRRGRTPKAIENVIIAQQKLKEHQEMMQKQEVGNQVNGMIDLMDRFNNSINDPARRKQALGIQFDKIEKALNITDHPLRETLEKMSPEDMNFFISGLRTELKSGAMSPVDLIKSLHKGDPAEGIQEIERLIGVGRESLGQQAETMREPAPQQEKTPAGAEPRDARLQQYEKNLERYDSAISNLESKIQVAE